MSKNSKQTPNGGKKNSKTILLLAVIALIAAGAAYLFLSSGNNEEYPIETYVAPEPVVDNNKKAGEDYLRENSKKPGVQILASGVQYEVLSEGNGKLANANSIMKVHYRGTLIDGEQFDSSYDRNEPLEINMASPGVIPGWVEVLKIMPEGAKWLVTLPSDMAYGARGAGSIQPFSTLIFEMEVVSIE